MAYIKKLTANSYFGEFEHTSADGIKVFGNFNTDASKRVNGFSGVAQAGDTSICDFSCNTYQNPVTFNYNNVSDAELLIEAIPEIQGAYEGVVEELEHVN